MERLPLARREQDVGDPPDDRVRELEPPGLRGFLEQHVPAGELAQGGCGLGRGQVGDRLQQDALDRRAEHRRGVDDRARRRRQPGEPDGHSLAYADGERERPAFERRRHPPLAGGVERQQALVHERGDELVHEERHAERLGVQPRRERGALVFGDGDHRGEHRLDVVDGDAPELDAEDARSGEERVERRARPARSLVGAEDHRDAAGEPRGGGRGELLAGVVRLVGVVEHDEDRQLLAHRGEHLHDGVAERDLVAGRGGEVLELRRERGHQPRHLGQRLGRSPGTARCVAQSGEQPARRGVRVAVGAARAKDERVCPDLLDELVTDAGLAAAAPVLHEDHRRRAVGGSPAGGGELGEHVPASDERRRAYGGGRPESPRDFRPGLLLQPASESLELLRRFDLERGAQPAGEVGMSLERVGGAPLHPERLDEAGVRALVERGGLRPPLGPGRGRVPVGAQLGGADQLLHDGPEPTMERGSLALYPPLELLPAQVLSPRQELPRPPRGGLLEAPLLRVALEVRHVERDRAVGEAHGVGAHLKGTADRLLDLEECLPERLAGALLRAIAPEQRRELGARSGAGGAAGKVGE